MTRLTRLKLLVAAAGVIMWGFGVRWQDERVTWVGVALLAAAFFLRFLGRREPRRPRRDA